MANRDLSTYREVTGQVVATNNDMVQAATDIGQGFIKQSQQAKIAENFSAAQLELNALTNQYQTDFEADPLGGMEEFKSKRQSILDKYGSDISPFYKNDWLTKSQDLAVKSDMFNQNWVFKQSKINAVNSLNTAKDNVLQTVAQDAENYAASEDSEVEAVMNFDFGKQELATTATEVLGEETTQKSLASFDEDATKVFVSTVADRNPIKALGLLDKEEVKTAFKNPLEYTQMREAVENRALRAREINVKREVLSVLSDENNFLTKTLEKPVSYLELQQQFEKTNMSEEAKKYFMKANGFTGEDAKLTDSQKLEEKLALYDDISSIADKPITPEVLQGMQNRVYAAMNNNAITQQEGVGYLNNLITPYADKLEEGLQGYSDNNVFADDVGFTGIKDYYESDVALPEPDTEKAAPEVALANNKNKALLYDTYFNSLTQLASGIRTQQFPQGATLADINKLSSEDKNKIFSTAQQTAKRAYLERKYPQLKDMPDAPNLILDNGKLVQGLAGNRNLNAPLSVKQAVPMLKGSDGKLYRQLPNGNYEVVK